MSLNPTGAPVETKVVAQLAYSLLTGAVTWVLASTALSGHLPAYMLNMLPMATAATAGGVAGWLARHTPRPGEVAAAVRRELAQQAPRRAAPPPSMPAPVARPPEPAAPPIAPPFPAPVPSPGGTP